MESGDGAASTARDVAAIRVELDETRMQERVLLARIQSSKSNLLNYTLYPKAQSKRLNEQLTKDREAVKELRAQISLLEGAIQELGLASTEGVATQDPPCSPTRVLQHEWPAPSRTEKNSEPLGASPPKAENSSSLFKERLTDMLQSLHSRRMLAEAERGSFHIISRPYHGESRRLARG